MPMSKEDKLNFAFKVALAIAGKKRNWFLRPSYGWPNGISPKTT